MPIELRRMRVFTSKTNLSQSLALSFSFFFSLCALCALNVDIRIEFTLCQIKCGGKQELIVCNFKYPMTNVCIRQLWFSLVFEMFLFMCETIIQAFCYWRSSDVVICSPERKAFDVKWSKCWKKNLTKKPWNKTHAIVEWKMSCHFLCYFCICSLSQQYSVFPYQ